MIKLTQKVASAEQIDASATLSLQQRIKSRLRISLDDGRDAGLFLPRGTTLKDGDLLYSDSGVVVAVKAAAESLSSVRSDDPLLLARACYHLGNRHVSVQISPGKVSYLHDHVLDEMLHGLGLTVSSESAPFEPEPGAYGGSAEAGHAHSHAHGHSHGHHHHNHDHHH